MNELVSVDRNRSLLELATDVEFWRKLNPDFAVTESETGIDAAPCEMQESALENSLKEMREQGYFSLDRVLDQGEIDRLAKLVTRLVEMDWPAPFAAIYDDFWHILQRCSLVAERILGPGYKVMPNFWVFHIPTNRNSSGWSPHRDRPLNETIKADKSPLSLRLWIPLTDATTSNSCICVLPAHLDPDYPHNLSSDKIQNIQNARCLPAARGSILGWNEALLHWGSNSSEESATARISIAFTLQANVSPFESPLIDPNVLPAFGTRLGLIGQMIKRFESRDSKPITQNTWDLAKQLSEQVEVTQCQCATCAAKLEQAFEAESSRKQPNFRRALMEATKLADMVMHERGKGNLARANKIASRALEMIGLSEDVDFVEAIELHLLGFDRPANEPGSAKDPAGQSTPGRGPETGSQAPLEPEAELDQMLMILSKALGAQHTRVKDTLLRLIERGGTWPTNYIHRLGPVYRHLLHVRELELGPTHPEIADRLLQYATYLENNAQHQQSRASIEKAVGIRRLTAGTNKAAQLAYAQALSRFGNVLLNTEDPRAAEANLREALAIADKHNWRGILTVRVLHDLGTSMLWSNRLDCETFLTRAIEMGRTTPVLSNLLRDTACKLADVYLFLGRIEDAIVLLEHNRYPDDCPLVLPQKNETENRQNNEIGKSNNPYADVMRKLRIKFNPRELYNLARPSLVRKYAWAIPTDEALAAIAKVGQVVEIGAGAGYWAALLRARGVDIIAYDAAPMETGVNKYTNNGRGWTEVLPGDVSMATSHPNRALMLCWPPRKDPMAMNALKAYSGNRVIYIGEGRNGMTADEDFQDALERDWRLVKKVEIDRWYCSSDALHIYERKK